MLAIQALILDPKSPKITTTQKLPKRPWMLKGKIYSIDQCPKPMLFPKCIIYPELKDIYIYSLLKKTCHIRKPTFVYQKLIYIFILSTVPLTWLINYFQWFFFFFFLAIIFYFSQINWENFGKFCFSPVNSNNFPFVLG